MGMAMFAAKQSNHELVLATKCSYRSRPVHAEAGGVETLSDIQINCELI